MEVQGYEMAHEVVEELLASPVFFLVLRESVVSTRAVGIYSCGI